MRRGCFAQPSVAVAERAAEPVVNPAGALSTASVLASVDEDEMSLEARQCVQALREGKRCVFSLHGACSLTCPATSATTGHHRYQICSCHSILRALVTILPWTCYDCYRCGQARYAGRGLRVWSSGNVKSHVVAILGWQVSTALPG